MIRIERRFRNEPNGQGGVLVVDKQPGEKDQSISGAGGGIRINVPKSKPHGRTMVLACVSSSPVIWANQIPSQDGLATLAPALQ